MANDENKDNSASQARAQLESIKEMVAALAAAVEADDDNAREDAERTIHEDALSVEVRSGWVAAGDKMEAAEFKILLCTGGPAVQIVGELDEHNEPSKDHIQLQHQDWFTPWTNLPLTDADRDALVAYARCFYFGDR